MFVTMVAEGYISLCMFVTMVAEGYFPITYGRINVFLRRLSHLPHVYCEESFVCYSSSQRCDRTFSAFSGFTIKQARIINIAVFSCASLQPPQSGRYRRADRPHIFSCRLAFRDIFAEHRRSSTRVSFRYSGFLPSFIG